MQVSEFFSGSENDLDEWENLGEEPKEPEAAETAAEVEQEQQAEERPRDDKGRFVKTQAEVEAEEAEERLYAGKYRSPEELERAYAEMQQVLGAQGSELGELRQMVEQGFQQVTHQFNQPRVDSGFDDLLDTNPAAAAEIALRAQNSAALERVRESWNELSPGSYDLWLANKQMEHRLQQMQQQLEQTTAPLHEQRTMQAATQAYFEAANEVGDGFQDTEAAMADVIRARPHMVAALQSGNRDAAKSVWLDAYSIARGRVSDTLSDAAKTLAREQAAANQRAKEEAALVSSGAALETAPLTLSDRIGQEWETDESSRASGWNV